MQSNDRVFVAGHEGLAGSALVRRLRRGGYSSLVLQRRAELDLRDRAQVDRLFAREPIDVVMLAAAKVGGIGANLAAPAEFIADNLAISLHVIEAARAAGVREILFLGSSCIYPRDAPQPISEASWLAGPPEPSNRAYAIAKISGVELCAAIEQQHGVRCLSVIPPNLYGPRDNYDLASGHVVAALLRKVHEAKLARAPRVSVWGTGTPRRELMHVDDFADACVFLLERPEPRGIINVGSGLEVSIAELATAIAQVVGYEGSFGFDAARPDGIPRKVLDSSRLAALGWTATIALDEGLRRTYASFLEELATGTAKLHRP